MKGNDQGERQLTMTNILPTKVFLRTVLLGTALTCLSTGTSAQSSGSVTVDLSAIDAPVPQVYNGHIVLRPPMGTAPISNSSGALKLRVPEPAKKATPKPKPVVVAETPAAPVAAPTPPPAPIKAAEPATQAAPSPGQTVAAAPAPAPTPKEVKPAAPVPAPIASAPPKPVPTPAPASAAAPKPGPPQPAAQPAPSPAVASTPQPSAAAARSAKQEPVGPVAAAMLENQQSAALPPATKAQAPSAPAEEVTAALTIPFAPGVTDIDVSSQGSVKNLAQSMSGDKSLRIQLMAYAADPEKNTSKARRLALDRAIAIRNMLIESGVERTRIEVRALGDQGEGSNLDRVDAVAIKR